MTGKQWIVRAASVALLWLSAVPAAARGAAAVPATKPAAADALAANGLTLVGPAYVLGVDAALADALKAVRQAKARQDAYAAKRAQLDRDVKSADRALTDANEQYRAALADLAAARRGTATNTYNQIVARTNTAQLRAADAQREVDRRNKALRDLPAPPDDYVGAVTDLAARMDAAVERYAALAADPAVTAAAAAASAAAKTPLKIGPSARFTQELPGVRRMKDAVVAAAVPCRVEGNTATVMVSLNDAAPVPMIWDSGASDVSLSADAAKAAGIVPGPDDPVVKYRIADGSSVEGRLVRARTIRVGQFTVRDVVCSVSSKSQKNAPLLLGGTFQRNFVARLNLGAGEIHLTPVGSDVTIGGGVAAGSTDAPAKPAPSPSSPAAPAAKAPPRGQVAVRATSTTANPMRTGLMLAAGQQVELIPDPGDRWQGGGTKSGQSCDYRGYPNQRGWMALKWRVGAATGDVVPTEPVVAREAGELLLYCEDEKPAGNNGSIRVTIIPGPPPVGVGPTAGPPKAATGAPGQTAGGRPAGPRAYDAKSLAARLARLRTVWPEGEPAAATATSAGSPTDLAAADPIGDKVTWAAAPAGYVIGKRVQIGGGEAKEDPAGHVIAEPGFRAEGGTIRVIKGTLDLIGTPDRPVRLRNVKIECGLIGSVRASFAVFDHCTFVKTGAWWATYSSKWTLEDCLVRDSKFASLSRVDYGLRLRRSSFVDCEFPDRPITKQDEAPVDAAKVLRHDWNEVTDCDLFRCRVPPSVTWYLRRCNLFGCPVTNPATLATSTDVAVELGFGPGEGPAAVADLRAKTSVTGPGKFAYAAAAVPYPTKAFPAE